uniref:Ig-like domain-containing protein n=1 Tax=Cyprinus carpio carpio TaxID=630221 RepID=A0A9J8DAE3_CYPCA
MGSSALPLMLLLMSFIHAGLTQDLPSLTVTPDSPVFTGETVNLTCEIKPYYSDWKYEWYKDNTHSNVMLQSSDRYTINRDTLTIRGVITSDQGQYWCRGRRDEGTISSYSRPVSLTVEERPKAVLKVSPDERVFRGERVTLTCDIQRAGDIQWTYSWFKDGNTHNPHTTTTTAEIRFTADYSAEYSCRGERSDSQRSHTSAAVTLTVSDSPRSTLTVTPDSPVFTGERVNLKCVIETYSNWRYEWYKDSVMLETSDRYTVNRDTLTIRGVITSDQDQYWCRGQIRSVWSQSNSAVYLSVKDKPKPALTVNPQSSVFTGDRVTLSCDVGQLTGSTILWRKDSNPESTGDETKTIESVSVSDEGEYRCRAQRGNYYSEFSNTVKITVKVRPKPVVDVDPDRRVFRGETVTLTCHIQQTGVWQYSLYKDHKQDYIIGREQNYKISSVDPSHSGVYSCRGAQTQAATHTQMSDGVTLTVSDLPRSTLTVTPDSPVFTGETVTLKCVIETYSDWRYEWYKDSVMLQTSDRYTVNRDTLTIRGVITNELGQYWCRGQRDERPNSSQSSSVSLSVKDSPRSTLTVTPYSPVFTGETVNLTCVIESHSNWRWRNYQTYGWIYEWTPEWRYEWYTDSVMLETSDRYTVNRNTLTIRGVITSDQGQYWCRGQRDERPSSSQESNQINLIINDLKPKPELTSDSAGAALTGNTVTLICRMNPATGWDFYWYKHTLNSETKTETNSYRVKIDSVSAGGQYWCRAGRGKPVYYTQYSDALWVNVTVSPKAVVTVRPDERVFRGETVALRCDIKWGGDTEWMYRWEREGTNYKHNSVSTQELNISSVKDFHSGKYSCRGQMGTQHSQRSNAVTLTVSAEAQAAVRVSPQPWLTEGDSVTLICEVTGSSTGWTFSWFRDDDRLSDSSRGAGGSYTLSPAALQHTGVYTCRAERGRPAYYTKNSSTQTLWITGQWSQVSLVVSPSRSQHFSSDSLSLSCEDQRNSAGWTVRRYTDRNTEDCSKQTGSTCRIVSLSTSDSGVYWCQSESGEKRHPLNITVHDGDVILESSVDPVIEGHTLTLHCLHRSTNSSILRADFYKDRSLVQNQTTGEMSITTVSKSHEGFYYCKTERGESLHSWISVRASSSLLVTAVVVGSSVCLLIFISLLLLWRYKKNKDQQHNINQTSVPNQSAESQPENSPLQSDSDQICDVVTEVKKRDKGDPEPLADVTYSEITVKKNKKKMDKGKSSESGDTLYSELKHNTDRGADAGDETYAQPMRKKNKTRL